MKPILSLENDKLRMPYWKTDKPELILKVTDKFLNTVDPCEKGRIYSIDIVFESYCIEKEGKDPIMGFYCKVPIVTP